MLNVFHSILARYICVCVCSDVTVTSYRFMDEVKHTVCYIFPSSDVLVDILSIVNNQPFCLHFSCTKSLLKRRSVELCWMQSCAEWPSRTSCSCNQNIYSHEMLFHVHNTVSVVYHIPPHSKVQNSKHCLSCASM